MSSTVPTAAAEKATSTFLSLAPATSNSYPQPKPRTQSTEGAAKPEIKRRSSSLGSEGAKGSNKPRVLKLGPVHWGEHLDDHQEDWHEVAIV